MTVNSLVPAAQYLRMSTDHQQYSLDNQADAIAKYAAGHGFVIVKTYSDQAKSGLSLKRRAGLKQLLKDTVEGHPDFKAILVYDVSRWGRFQDADEAAHYEYLCKSSGAAVNYCAETFGNTADFSDGIMKALKRTMAAEYSRELSTKVRAGQLRLARLGYKLGGHPPYGLRRLLLDPSGSPKQILAPGERKSLVTERVVLVPGPPEEVAIVERIFRVFVDEHRSLSAIAKTLNSEGVRFLGGAQWNAATVTRLLRQSAYTGTQVWGRTTALLSSPVKQVAPEEWAICPKAFDPIISPDLFESAQQRFAGFTCHLTDEQLLERIRVVLRACGKLSGAIIEESRLCPGGTTYGRRFGGLMKMYARLGFDSERRDSVVLRQRMMMVRQNLIREAMEMFPNQVDATRSTFRHRVMLRCRRTGLLIAVLIARCYPTRGGVMRWFVIPAKNERKRATLLVLLNEQNTSVAQLRVFRNMRIQREARQVREGSKWLQSGIPLDNLSNLMEVVQQVTRAQ
jgi:DNA invertase Pin-like site-specific DNA recombinase